MVKAFAGSPITMVPSAKHPVAVSVTRTTYVPTATLAKVNVFPVVSMFLFPMFLRSIQSVRTYGSIS
jgi:hypothetical protein